MWRDDTFSQRNKATKRAGNKATKKSGEGGFTQFEEEYERYMGVLTK